ncbi:MAG TPA: preprotein translocase subunit YajC [Cryomorphaceae bacterium]|nr:preprotein translocase subunit YajC [Cryomorphaceae bacterium]
MTHLILQSSADGAMSFLPLLMIILVMYLFFFRPQMKKQKEEGKFRSAVAKGNRVVLTSGIHGKILEVGETHIVLECENSRLKVDKSAISKELSAQYQSK